MAKIKPALLLPLRFIDLLNINSGFDGDFAVNQVLSYQTAECYLQKWQLSDSLKLQIASYAEPSDLLIRDIFTDEIVETLIWSEIDTNVIDETFRIYEIEYLLLNLPEGKYYTEFSYTDENDIERPQQSEGIDLKELQENTKLIRYRNSRNSFDVIFDTGIEFQIRVECAIKNGLPKNDRNTYNDQDFNITLLSSTPFLIQKFWLGFQYGVPRWVADKINRIQSVNQVYYDDVAYQVPSGSEYEFEENDLGNDWIGGSIEIRPVDENKFNRYETTPIEPENIFTPMQKRLRYFDLGADFSIPAVFNDHSMLELIWIRKSSPGDIDLKVGTTPGGNEIGDFLFNTATFIWEDTYLFDAASTLYLTGLDGSVVTEMQVIYKQTDVDDVDVSDFNGGGGDPVPPQLGIGAVIIFDGTEEQWIAAFDDATGLGKANTPWSEWIIWDGRNDVSGRDPRGLAIVGYKEDDPNFGDLDTPVGSNTNEIEVVNLPDIGNLVTDYLTLNRPAVGGGEQVFWPKALEHIGEGEPLNNIQRSLPVRLVKKVA